ncbi:MAG: hypothetical protein ACK5T0_00570 [Vampirovibrionales bacterium]
MYNKVVPIGVSIFESNNILDIYSSLQNISNSYVDCKVCLDYRVSRSVNFEELKQILEKPESDLYSVILGVDWGEWARNYKSVEIFIFPSPTIHSHPWQNTVRISTDQEESLKNIEDQITGLLKVSERSFLSKTLYAKGSFVFKCIIITFVCITTFLLLAGDNIEYTIESAFFSLLGLLGVFIGVAFNLCLIESILQGFFPLITFGFNKKIPQKEILRKNLVTIAVLIFMWILPFLPESCRGTAGFYYDPW